MESTFGPNFHDDENIILTETRFGKINFSKVEDVTSGANHSIGLLREDATNQVCVVLVTPPTSQIELVKVSAAGIPTEFKTLDQAPPGLPGNEIFYRLTADKMSYVTAKCNHVTWNGSRMIRKEIACEAN